MAVPTRTRAMGRTRPRSPAADRAVRLRAAPPRSPEVDDRVPPSKLPAVLRRAGHLARWDLDAAGRPGVARAHDHRRRSALAGRRGRRAVPAGHGPGPLRGDP